MKKKLLALLIVFLCGVTPYILPQSPHGDVITVFDAVIVNATAIVTSDEYVIKRGQYFGVHYSAISSSGTADVDIVYEMSSTTATGFVQPDAGGVIADDLTDELWHVESVQPPPMKYIRFSVTGNATNPANTVVTLKFFVQG